MRYQGHKTSTTYKLRLTVNVVINHNIQGQELKTIFYYMIKEIKVKAVETS